MLHLQQFQNGLQAQSEMEGQVIIQLQGDKEMNNHRMVGIWKWVS